MDKKVLIVEDNQALADTIIQFLELNGVLCDFAATGDQALALANNQQYDVIVSDIDMPRMNGLELCTSLRERGIDTPLIMLTGLDSLSDKLLGFDCGADDYMTKPFEVKELLARINALSLRRSGQVKLLAIQSLDLFLNIDEHTVSHNGKTIALTRSSWLIMEPLARRYPNALRYEDLRFYLWGDDPPESDALKVYLHRLRKELGMIFSRPIIHTVKDFGVILRLDCP